MSAASLDSFLPSGLPDPLLFACPHGPTPEERARDPRYLGCGAKPHEPCRWASRFDGENDPPFHAVRLELAARGRADAGPVDAGALREAVLLTGLV